uniref:macrosialin-like n=1 Tax=Semicossyphus pulcher TaxID=241346 RepID=UPI0037E76DCF
MKGTAVFVFVAFCALSALSLAEDEEESNPSATVVPAFGFDSTTKALTTTIKPTTTTTKPKTTTIKPKTTTIKPNTTTTTKPKTTTIKPNTTTTKPKTTTTKPKTTTIKPKTTTIKPKTTTTKPKTTTIKPKTTTIKPKTTIKPNTTTTKPKTTTTKAPTKAPTTTTKAPGPPPPTPSTNLTGGNYTLMTNKTVICLMAQMELQIRLVTPKDNGTFKVLPKMTKVEGECKDPKANLTLVFHEGSITFMFNKSVANNSVYVNALSFDLVYPLSKTQFKFSGSNSSLHLFAAKVGHSYSCRSQSVYMGNGLYLDVNKDRMQAFNLTKSNEFGLSDPCPADQNDYRVAVAVGVTLLVLIVIVVLAYLLGRRRRTDGYQTL